MLIVTIAALVMAASLGWYAFRLMQEEQRRSEARVALLTAALDDTAADGDLPPARTAPVGFARSTSPQAPRVPAGRPAGAASPADAAELPGLVYLDDEPRPGRWFRSEAPTPEVPMAVTPTAPPFEDSLTTQEAPPRASGLFADVPEAKPADARGVIAVGGVVLVGALALGYAWLDRPAPTHAATASTPAAAEAAPATGGIPLDLLSLAHEQRNGAIVVRGRVRNPVAGSDRAGLVASVMLLDQAGGFLGSGRGALETARLRPGDDVGFAVEVPSHKDVRRYRVTFRNADGSLVPHADRRSSQP